jgi:signal transduction histidine kinase/ActR/RegA family two-component response regulator
MKSWFLAQPIRRKLVVMALGVTAVVLAFALVALIVFDLWRFRFDSGEEISSLARMVAENTAPAVSFGDEEVAAETLATLRIRPSVRIACLFLPDGVTFASYRRSPDLICRSDPHPHGWLVVSGSAPVELKSRTLGSVYIERELVELPRRVGIAASGALLMLVIGGALAYGLAQRLQRAVSAPIVHLATAVRSVGPEQQQYTLPPLEASPDEVGDLTRAFVDMVDRVRASNARLLEANAEAQREIQERRRVEAEREVLLLREREASRLKDEFLATVSHELRTPLNAMLGWAHVLMMSPPDPQRLTKGMSAIVRNGTAQARVIDDLMDVSRIITGKLQLRVSAVDLQVAMEEALEIIRPAAEGKRIAVHVRPADTPCFVGGDLDRLRQIIWNLLANAVKFTPPDGTISVEVTATERDCRIDVTDNGVGIPPELLPHVFDRFRQGDGSTTREHGGLGLGLSIVKELTELHGGTVTATSGGTGHGATFTVRLPRVASPREPAAPDTGVHPQLEGVRVLAVDDNADALDIIAATLSDAGALVRTADSGERAIQEWDRDSADVLICDLAMPRMDGFEVLSEIRQRNAGTGRSTPAIALTAHVSAESLARATAVGFSYHLSKPYRAEDLVRLVSLAVRRL